MPEPSLISPSPWPLEEENCPLIFGHSARSSSERLSLFFISGVDSGRTTHDGRGVGDGLADTGVTQPRARPPLLFEVGG